MELKWLLCDNGNSYDMGNAQESVKPLVKIVKGKKTYQFENLFAKRNTRWLMRLGSRITILHYGGGSVSAPRFGTTGGKLMSMKEVAAFLGHVGSKTSCGYGVATGGPLAWGLCYNKEMSPSKVYCDDYYKYTYPCTPGVSYHGRGALPIYWNFNYGETGKTLNVDLLNHPEYLENNATLAFQTAIWRWMTPVKKNQPSAQDVFIGNWKPTKNDTLAKRIPGLGTTMNVLYGDQVCGQGDVDSMNNIISHYLYYLDLMGVGREEAGPHEVLTCEEQKPFTVSPSASSS
ncbi:chitinase-like protein 2 [Hibiscus syriacus]|uniref:chitinase-like protein 2 n=1 Tax=Hibiscus syriacus TaxID=106335 RepID=UPI001920CA0F|nr:chitinase-like protein 2 [Hibiscus syriacus]